MLRSFLQRGVSAVVPADQGKLTALEKRRIERLARDNGLSRQEAKRIAALAVDGRLPPQKGGGVT